MLHHFFVSKNNCYAKIKSMEGGKSYISVFISNKVVRIIALVDLLLVVALIAYAAIKNTNNAYIYINVAPVDSKITINGKSHYKNGTYIVKAGSYNISISHDGLKTKTFNLNLDSDEKANMITFLVGENNDMSYYLERNNSASYEVLNQIAAKGKNVTYDKDKSAEKTIEKYNRAIGLTKLLPIENTERDSGDNAIKKSIIIKKSTENSCKSVLCIDALMLYTTDEKEVKSIIVEKGYNPEDYEINYKKH